MKLPKELSTYVKKKILKRILPCLTLAIVFFIVLLFWGDRMFQTDIFPFKISCYLIVMVIPFAVTGVPFKLIDYTFCGEIIRVDIEEGIEFDKNLKARMYGTLNFALTIRKENGKFIYRSVKASNYAMSKTMRGCTNADYEFAEIRKPEHWMDNYQEGDRVFHLYGSKYIIVLPNEKSTHCQCAVCGATNSIKNSSCEECGHILMKNENL